MGLTAAIRKGIQASYPFGGGAALDQWGGIRQGHGSISLSGNLTSSYALIYASQPWVAICVNKFTHGIMRQPLKAYQRDGKQREVLTEGPLAELMANPNPVQSPADYKQAITGNLSLYSNAIVVKSGRARPGAPPTELWPSAWPNWEVVRGKTRPVDWYLFHASNGEKIPFRPEEVMHFHWWAPGPRGDIVGSSLLEPLRQILLSEDATFRTIVASMENGLRPGGAFSTPNTFNLTKEADKASYDRLRADLASTYGGVDNAFKFLLLHGGLDWKPMGQSFVDAEVVAIHKLDRETVVACFDLPQPVVGIVDEANFASIDAYHTQLYQDSYGPINELIEQGHNKQLLNEPVFAGQFVEFDQNDVLKGDVKTRMDAYRLATFMTDNEKRQRENLPPIDDPRADMLYKPLNETPIGPGSEDFGDMPELVTVGANGNGNGRG